jgi:hypothetical protein
MQIERVKPCSTSGEINLSNTVNKHRKSRIIYCTLSENKIDNNQLKIMKLLHQKKAERVPSRRTKLAVISNDNEIQIGL